MPDQLLTSTQAGHILGCSAKTVVRRAIDGQLPYAHKVPGPNGAYLFDRAAVDAHLEAVTQ